MARSATTLTKYKSAVTIVTADTANAWYGGLYGSAEAAGLDANDPLVAGHVHDGQRIDGHAQKIDLVDHVTNQLRNVNLGTDAVDKRTVNKFITQGDAIPESELIGGTTYYYLDLSALRTELGIFEHDSGSDTVRYNTTNGPDNGTTDFVINSPTLDYDASYPTRMFFDVSSASFRVGTTSGIQWDSGERGAGSFAWGTDTQASGSLSFAGGSATYVSSTSGISSVVGGIANAIDNGSVVSFIGGGGQWNSGGFKPVILSGNVIDNGSLWSFIGAGGSNSIGPNLSAYYSVIAGGAGNTVDNGAGGAIVGGESNSIGTATTVSSNSFIGSGDTNSIARGINSAIVAGELNTLSDSGDNQTDSIIGAGESNNLRRGSKSFIGAGFQNIMGGTIASEESDESAIVAGRDNYIHRTDQAFIGAGDGNQILFASGYSTIVAGLDNRIGSTGPDIQAIFSFIGAGRDNIVEEYWSSIVGGQQNTIANNAQHGFIGGGALNTIGDGTNSTDHSVIGGGEVNTIQSEWAFIGSGENNTINDVADHGVIAGGELNTIGDDVTSSLWSVIVGGRSNTTEGIYSVIVGGNTNQSLGDYNSIINGESQTVSNGIRNLIGGGSNNIINEHDQSVIAGGRYHQIDGVDAVETPFGAGILAGNGNDIINGRGATVATVSAGGSGYAVNDILTYAPGASGYAQAYFRVTGVSTGAVTSVAVIKNGHWITDPTNPVSTITTVGSGTGCTLNLISSDNNLLGRETAGSTISGGSSNRLLSSEDSSIVTGSNNYIMSGSDTHIGGGINNIAYATSYSSIVSGAYNVNNGLGYDADKSTGVNGLYGNTILNGSYNLIEWSAYNATAQGVYALANSWGMAAQASDSITQGQNEWEGPGEAQTAVLTFVGLTGTSDSTNYYIYLNNNGEVTTPASDTTGYGLYIPDNTVGIIEWTAIGAQNLSNALMAYKGYHTFYRGTGDITFSSSSTTAISALTGGGAIAPFNDTKFGAGFRDSIIFEVTTGTSGAGNGANARWEIRAEVTWIVSTFG